MTFDAQGEVEMKIDGSVVYRSEGEGEEMASGDVALTRGAHGLAIRYGAVHAPGYIEWRWRPPSGIESIVPPSALVPPPGAGVGPPQPLEALGPAEFQPREHPVVIRW
jgi:hypothetical protein